ncbi:MAG: HAD family hydrolase [Candidatus Dormibacteria bacterium]
MTVRGAPPPLAEAILPDRVEMVVLDLDGTCLDFHQQLHPRIEAAVRQAGERVPVVIASGRMYRSALPWARRLGVRAPLICYQGALVQAMPDPDPGDGLAHGRVVATEVLDAATAQLAIAVAREHGWHRQAYVDDNLLCEEDRPEARLYAQVGDVPIQFVDDLALAIAGGTVKVVCVVLDSEEAVRCRVAMTVALGARARVTPSYPQFIEIASPRAGKGPAVRRVAAALGVDLFRAVAIGDAPNDSDMLETVGFGVAVEGALDEVLGAADCTCPPPTEGGVADVLVALGLARP